MARRQVNRTSPPLFPEHPESEHRWRIDRARQIMQDQDLDVLLLTRNVNVFYATGTRFVFVGMEAPVAFCPQSAAIITSDADVYCQRFGPFDRDEVPLHTAWSDSIELYDDELELGNILQDYGVGRGARIGTEWGLGLPSGIHPLKFQTLQQDVEGRLGAEIVDGTPAIWKITGIKSDLEIERMRVAVQAASRAMVRLLEVIKIGMNELEAARTVRQFMLEEGAESAGHAQVMGATEGGLTLMSCNALDRPIGAGWVTMDIGCTYKHYKSDINRGIFLGREPTAVERQLYECRVGVNELLDRTICPGVPVDDVLAQMVAYVESQGCTVLKRDGEIFAGHGLGLESYQHPALAPSSTQPEFQNEEGKMLFEKGMMFTYEMPLRVPGSDASFNVEDNVVVTAGGVENMSAAVSREIKVRR